MSCIDNVTLHRLLDGELDEIQSELVTHHVGGCDDCRHALQEAGALRAFVQGQLGSEDETEEDAASAAMKRVAGRVGDAVNVRPASVWRTRRMLFVAAAVAVLAILPPAFVTSVNAWSGRVLEKASASERMWKYHPNRTLYWEVRTSSRGVKGLTDGEWRTEFWQKNDDTTLRQHSRQFDPEGKIFHAYWRQPDGSLASYRPRQHVLEFAPPTVVARQALLTLPPHERAALNLFLARREAHRSLEVNRRRDAEWLHRPRLSGRIAKIQRGPFESWPAVYHITIVSDGRESSREIAGATHEYAIETTTYRLLRLRSTIRYKDGTTGVHDSRWSAPREIGAEEFDSLTPQRLVGSDVRLVRVAPTQLARNLVAESPTVQQR